MEERERSSLLRAIGTVVKEMLAERDKRLADLEEALASKADAGRVAELSATIEGRRYVGTWSAGREFVKGNLVTHQGSVWHCNSDTKMCPTEGHRDWTLAVKHGRDLR